MTLIEQLSSDARFALRSLKRAKGFTTVALATLILGIASFTSIFSYLNAAYFAALAYHQATRSVALSEDRPANQFFPPFSAVSLDAVELVRAGRLGRIRKVTAAIGGGPTGGPFKKEQPPADLLRPLATDLKMPFKGSGLKPKPRAGRTTFGQIAAVVEKVFPAPGSRPRPRARPRW